jgi:predicted component of type VI protein secretion system
MATPLARRLKLARRLLVERPEEFELTQLLRLLRRADGHPVDTTLVRDEPGATPVVRNVTPPTRTTPAALEVDAGLLPVACDDGQASDVVAYLQEVWEIANPFAAGERGADGADRFTQEACTFAGVAARRDVGPGYLAHAAGSIRRRGAADVAAVCAEYFDVPVCLEPINGRRGRLRVGPLTFAEYAEFLSGEDDSAVRKLFALAAALLGPAIEIEVVFVLKADEVPPCVPGTIGATVGLTAWPRQGRAPHREDMEHTISNCDGEDLP